jgi:hypothetical protein
MCGAGALAREKPANASRYNQVKGDHLFAFILEFVGEFLLEALCHLTSGCVQELLRWTRDIL